MTSSIIYLGNWKNLSENELRLKPNVTMNKGFFSCLVYFLGILPLIEKKYINSGAKIILKYYSHIYGNYPNFLVFGDSIFFKHNYDGHIETIPQITHNFQCCQKLFHSICGSDEGPCDTSNFYSYKYNFSDANKYFNKYFGFSEKVIKRKELFCEQFKNKKVLGLHFRGTDKLKVNWVQHMSIEQFIIIVDYHLCYNKYDSIFIATDDILCLNKLKDKYGDKYTILYVEQNLSTYKPLHLSRFNSVNDLVVAIKKQKKYNSSIGVDELENKLKYECEYNQIQLENLILDSLILSECNTVLKTHSQLSGFSKIFNPKLEIFRLNGSSSLVWPESHIPLYPIDEIINNDVKQLLLDLRWTEPDNHIKNAYRDYC
jgi:hypothetical protein